MRKLIAAINMTLDGYCDHTAVNASEELHQHYTDLLGTADTILYGRVTFQLMEFWPTLLKNPSDNKQMNDFAAAIDKIPKVIFSRTLKHIDWDTARLVTKDLKEEVLELREQAGGDILVGSPGIIVALTQLKLIDEYQVCIHPVIVGQGLPLFKNISDRVDLTFLKRKDLGSGPVVLYYKTVR